HAIVLNDSIRGPWVAVAGLADAARVDNQLAANLQYVRMMRVAHANDIGVYMGQPACPEIAVRRGVFVKRIARGGMDKEKSGVVRGNGTCDWQSRQESSVLAAKPFLGDRPGDASQIFEAALAVNADPLCGSVIVVAANADGGIFPYPIDARRRFHAVIH